MRRCCCEREGGREGRREGGGKDALRIQVDSKLGKFVAAIENHVRPAPSTALCDVGAGNEPYFDLHQKTRQQSNQSSPQQQAKKNKYMCIIRLCYHISAE